MVKNNNSILIGRQGTQCQLSIGTRLISAGLALVVVLCGLSEPAYCQRDGTALLLQQTPTQGGKITPDVGVHHFELNSEVTLTAVPKPGYQFVYWMGDVSNPTTNRTTLYLDAPKIVIAVFERVEYEFLVMDEQAKSAPGSRLHPSAAGYSRQGYSGGGAKRPSKPRTPQRPEPEEPPDFPVPEIPEPATGVLLVLGSLLAIARPRTKKQTRMESSR